MADGKQIRRISIEPAETGGHTVEHRYKDKPSHSKKNGMSMQYVEPETFVFGKDEDEKMLGHVAKHLGLKAAGKGAPQVEDKDGDGE